MIVILNPKAGAGTAQAKWKRIEPRVRDLAGPFTTYVAHDLGKIGARIAAALQAGETEFIAAGGDGTVNLVLTNILENASRGAIEMVKLGAVGLGSSNDYHKPLDKSRVIDGVPFKLDFISTIRHDVCLLTYRDESDVLRSRRWIINASVGTTAEANHFFNNPNGPLRLFKRFIPSLAMAYAALRTIVRYKSRPMTITVDETETVQARVKNLGIVKNPHFTGELSYDSPYEPGGGYFYVHLLKRVSALRLVLTLVGLLRGKFSGRKRTGSWRATRVRINADSAFAIEGDGEVITARRAYFSIVPNLIQVCT